MLRSFINVNGDVNVAMGLRYGRGNQIDRLQEFLSEVRARLRCAKLWQGFICPDFDFSLNLALSYFHETEGSTMRRLLCFFFVFSSLTPAVAVSDDCGCSGQSVVLNDETRDALERWEAQQVWERPTLLASNVSAIIRSDFGDFTSQRGPSDPLSATNAMGGNLFEEITTHSIATASSDTLNIEEMRKRIRERLKKRNEQYITNHFTRSLMCKHFLSSDPKRVRRFTETLKSKKISIEQVFLYLRCPIESSHYALCQNSSIPDDRKRDGLDLPLCGDIFFLAAFYPAWADSLFIIIKSLIAHDSERFLPKILQCKRLTRTFYNKKRDQMETRCLPLIDIAENKLSYRMLKNPDDIASRNAFANITHAFEKDYFKLLPDESPPTKEFCQKYATLSCHEDLPDRNAW